MLAELILLRNSEADRLEDECARLRASRDQTVRAWTDAKARADLLDDEAQHLRAERDEAVRAREVAEYDLRYASNEIDCLRERIDELTEEVATLRLRRDRDGSWLAGGTDAERRAGIERRLATVGEPAPANWPEIEAAALHVIVKRATLSAIDGEDIHPDLTDAIDRLRDALPRDAFDPSLEEAKHEAPTKPAWKVGDRVTVLVDTPVPGISIIIPQGAIGTVTEVFDDRRIEVDWGREYGPRWWMDVSTLSPAPERDWDAELREASPVNDRAPTYDEVIAAARAAKREIEAEWPAWKKAIR